MNINNQETTVPLSCEALIRRINRHLVGEGEGALRILPYPRLDPNIQGDYVLVVPRNFIVLEHGNLETFGRALGVLKPHERLGEDEGAG